MVLKVCLQIFLHIHLNYLQTLILVQGKNVSNKDNDLRHVSKCEEDKTYPWCISFDYDKYVEPWKFREKTNFSLPWIYYFNFDVLDIKQVNDLTQTITIMMYLRIKWLEPRLEINGSSIEWIQDTSALLYSPHLLNHLWYPGLEVYGVDNFEPKSILKEMGEVNIFKTKFVKYHTRADATISCQMNFDHYPLDSHICPFQISSYRSTEETVSCSSEFIYQEPIQRHLQYSVTLDELPKKYQTFSIRKNFVYKTCGFNIILSRERSQIFFQVYLTSAMFVVVSWLSFIIKPEVVPGRISLLLTTFLVLVNLFNSAKSQAPVSKYLNAIDVYLVGCIMHVFFALIEYSIVLCIVTRKKSCFIGANGKTNELPPPIGSMTNSLSLEMNVKSKNQFYFNKIDAISIFFFPLCFLIFIFVYVAVYI